MCLQAIPFCVGRQLKKKKKLKKKGESPEKKKEKKGSWKNTKNFTTCSLSNTDQNRSKFERDNHTS